MKIQVEYSEEEIKAIVVAHREYMMLRQAVNNVLHNGIEDSEGTHVQEQERKCSLYGTML